MILLQTLLQLNILILASLALAGWTLIPFAQPGAVRAVCIVWQGRTAEVVAPKPERAEPAQTTRAAHPHPLVLPRFMTPSIAKPTAQAPAFLAAPTAALISLNPFPHATRAP